MSYDHSEHHHDYSQSPSHFGAVSAPEPQSSVVASQPNEHTGLSYVGTSLMTQDNTFQTIADANTPRAMMVKEINDLRAYIESKGGRPSIPEASDSMSASDLAMLKNQVDREAVPYQSEENMKVARGLVGAVVAEEAVSEMTSNSQDTAPARTGIFGRLLGNQKFSALSDPTHVTPDNLMSFAVPESLPKLAQPTIDRGSVRALPA